MRQTSNPELSLYSALANTGDYYQYTPVRLSQESISVTADSSASISIGHAAVRFIWPSGKTNDGLTGGRGTVGTIMVEKEVNSNRTGKAEAVSAAAPGAITMADIASPSNLCAAAAAVRKNTRNLKEPSRSQLREFCSRVDLEFLRQQLQQGNYTPSPFRQMEVTKNGKTRVLSVPALSDRIVQTALKQVLEPVCEGQLFQNESYAYRPNRSMRKAVLEVWKSMATGLEWVLKVDLRSFFDGINQERLLGVLSERLGVAGDVIELIRASLKAGRLFHGVYFPTERGVPQGGIISPLLANIYGTLLDERLIEAGIRFVRYADDLLLLTKTEGEARLLKTTLVQALAELELELNDSKTEVKPLTQTIFLGVAFTKDGLAIPTARAKRKAEDILCVLEEHEGEEALDKARASLLGWWQHYRSIDPGMTGRIAAEQVAGILANLWPPHCNPVIEALKSAASDSNGIGLSA